MKLGFYPKLAFDAIRKNKRMYFPYLLTGAVMVMMYYILRFLQDSPALLSMEGGTTLRYLLPLGCFVIAFFSLLFLFYTNSFLIRQRYREFGLYNILGMDKGNISRLLLWETVYAAVVAILAGLFLGMALSKAAELVLLNLLDLEISFSLTVSVASLRETALLYGVIYLLLLANSLVKIRRSRPLELMRSANVGEQPPKCNWLLALLGLVLLSWAYYLAVSIEEPTAALLLFFVAVLMVIGGTYLLFIAGSVAFCRLLQKNKGYYKANHFVSVSSMVYRMKRNGAGLASICILLTMVLVMLSSTSSLYFGEEDALNNRYPHGINIEATFGSLDGIGDSTLEPLREGLASCAPAGTDLTGTRYAVAPGQFTEEGIILDYTQVANVDYDRVGYLYVISLADYNAMMGESKTLAPQECLLYSGKLDLAWSSFTMEFGEAYQVKERLTAFQEDGAALAMTMPSVYLVVPDMAVFSAPVSGMKNSAGYLLVEFKWLLGFDCGSAQQELAARDGVSDLLHGLLADNPDSRSIYVESRESNRSAFYEMYGSLFFLGIMLSIVFLMAAVLIIYYKQISEGYEDQGRFAIMQKVGMTKTDIRRSINSQMLTVFFLPLVLAGLHLAFAFPFISKILTMFAFDDTLLNICVCLACYGVFGLFYTIVYKITSGSYYAIVSGGKDAP